MKKPMRSILKKMSWKHFQQKRWQKRFDAATPDFKRLLLAAKLKGWKIKIKDFTSDIFDVFANGGRYRMTLFFKNAAKETMSYSECVDDKEIGARRLLRLMPELDKPLAALELLDAIKNG